MGCPVPARHKPTYPRPVRSVPYYGGARRLKSRTINSKEPGLCRTISIFSADFDVAATAHAGADTDDTDKTDELAHGTPPCSKMRMLASLTKKSPSGTVSPEGLTREVLMTEDLFLGQSPHVTSDWLREDNDATPLHEASQRA